MNEPKVISIFQLAYLKRKYPAEYADAVKKIQNGELIAGEPFIRPAIVSRNIYDDAGRVQPSFMGLYDSLEYRGAVVIERGS
jgi:hypothetical protein